jgi:hypothetical protein
MSEQMAMMRQQIVELKQLVMREKTNRLNDSLFSKELAPHYTQLAEQLSRSQLVPKAYQGKPADLFIAMAMGYQIGMSVEQSIQAIAVINGKPCLWGDDMLALCMIHPDFEDIIEEPIYQSSVGTPITGFNCTVKRRGMSDYTQPFTLDMARKAGLLAKQGPWTQYPERMLQLRARAFALRNRFPDALKGIKSREEVEDYIDAEYTVSTENKGSHTELLKRDFLAKKGVKNAEIIEEVPLVCSEEKANENTELQDMGEAGEEKDILHAEIRLLLNERGFDLERRAKALAYYEVEDINDLSIDSSLDFIEKLKK